MKIQNIKLQLQKMVQQITQMSQQMSQQTPQQMKQITKQTVKPKASKAKAPRSTTGKYEAPPNWRLIFENIRKMREERDAIVDNMGAEMAVDKSGSPKVFYLS